MRLPEIPEMLNLADHLLVERLREGRGDRVALHTDDGTWTYEDVDRLSRRSACPSRGLALPDGPEMVGAIFGTLRIGAVAVMVNPRLGREEIGALYPYVRPRAAVVHAEGIGAFAAARDDRWPAVFLVCGGPGDGHPTFDEVAGHPSPELDTYPTHRDDPAIWLFSGGTTGRPKAVVQTHRSVRVGW